MRSGHAASLGVTLCLCGMSLTAPVVVPAGAQTPTSPPSLFRYTAAGLACVTFLEHSHATLDAQTAGRQRRETLRRDGRLRLRARDAAPALAVEAWYDSLALSRESPEATLVPDTDGLLGGRYRGRLTSSGRYAAEVRPFVPDEIAEVADLGGAMDDLLPPLPPIALAVGQRWTNGRGLELRRLPDSAAAGRDLWRLELRSRTESNKATVRGDTISIAARQVTVEEGQVDWDPGTGLARRVRRLVVDTFVPASGPLKQPLRSRLEQDVELVRSDEECPAGS